LSRREEKAPAKETNGSVVSQSTFAGKPAASNNVVLGEPKTEGLSEDSSDEHFTTTNVGETVTQAPASEQAAGTGEAPLTSHTDSAEPSTDIYVPTAPEPETEEVQDKSANAPAKSGGMLSKFTEKFA
jgi:hypothetical protein